MYYCDRQLYHVMISKSWGGQVRLQHTEVLSFFLWYTYVSWIIKTSWHGKKSILLVCGIHRSPFDYPHKGPMMQSCGVYFDIRQNTLLKKYSICRWFDTTLTWRDCNVWRKKTLHIYINYWTHWLVVCGFKHMSGVFWHLQLTLLTYYPPVPYICVGELSQH